MGGANVGETNSDKQRIQAKDNLIRSQQDQINRLEDHVQKRNAYIELLEAEQQRQTARTEQLQQSVRRERGLRASMEAELQEEKAHNEQQQQRLRREAGLRATAEDDAQHLFDKYNDKKDQLRELARYTRRLEDKVNKMESRRRTTGGIALDLVITIVPAVALDLVTGPALVVTIPARVTTDPARVVVPARVIARDPAPDHTRL
ncbi:hypothetical protein BFW01_g5946 [Lasiodiplodia theobromae]|nr:hypothetical protein BFW01_g5946 [Lasiodiplodia theobromae]